MLDFIGLADLVRRSAGGTQYRYWKV